MSEKKFDPRKLAKLNNPQRLHDIPPERIWSRLTIEKPRVIVDIGAGTGFFSVPFKALSPEALLYACDTSDVMLQWMQENICPSQPGIIALKVQESSIPLEDGLAELVFMINLHHELERPEETLREAWRLLKSTGNLFIVDWKKQEMEEGPAQHLRYEPDRVKQQVSGSGFSKVMIYEDMPKHFLLVAEKP